MQPIGREAQLLEVNSLIQPTLLAIPPQQPAGDSAPTTGPQLEGGVDRTTAYTFADIGDVNLQWYVPTISVVPPSPAQAAAVSPFRYSFRIAGHDQHGAPVIDASVTATVQADPFDSSRATLADGATTRAVPFSSVNVSLTVPFRDSESGQPTSTTVPATTLTPVASVPSGTGWTATFELTGDLARAAYG